MFVSFDLLAFVFWLLISTFIPGAILSFSLFKKDEFSAISKLFLGFALGFVLLPLIPFLLYFIAGIKFSYEIALLSVGVLYLIAIAFFVKNKAYEISLPESIDRNKLLLSVILLVILIFSYMVRIGSYSPIFQELDPYFYTYTAQQLLVLGENPFDDQTSWYPEVEVNHRIIPELSYLEATWYSLYTGGADYNNMTLSLIASMYPPIAAMLAVFLIYALIATVSKKEWGIAAAGIAAFLPIFLYKLAAGEMEVQPYAFFSLFFLYAMYALSLVKKDLRFSALSGLAFAAVALGSSSQILAVASLLIFMILQSVAYFIKKKDASDLRFLFRSNAIIFVIGPLFGSAILKDVFTIGSPSVSIAIPFLLGVAITGVLYLLKENMKQLQQIRVASAGIAAAVVLAFVILSILLYAAGQPGGEDLAQMLQGSIGSFGSSFYAIFVLAVIIAAGIFYLFVLPASESRTTLMILLAVIMLGLFVFAATPFGDYVESIGKSGFGLSEFNTPLDRTIAEQNLAPSTFGSQMGFIGDIYIDENGRGVVSMILWPLTALSSLVSLALGSSHNFSVFIQDLVTNIILAVGTIISIPLFLISTFVNIAFTVAVETLNLLLGTTVEYTSKANSFMLFWVFAFWAALAYSLYRFVTKEEDNLFLLFFAVVMPPFVVGLIKAKYTIYSAVLLAVGIGFVLGVSSDALSKIKNWNKALLIIAAFLVIFQFIYNGYAVSLLWGSVQPLYQDDPAALQVKFQQFCQETGDPEVCAAAADPMGYASQGTNYQYSQKLCMLSLYSEYRYLQGFMQGDPFWEMQASYFRCSRLSTYWVDSMEWIKDNTEEGSRVISWWDYGHWINYFGQRNSVLRNEHTSHDMIGAVADAYLDATPETLKEYMTAHDSKYALFDIELIAGGGSLGGKYGALNYLSCAWNNETNVSFGPGESRCEADHLWETIYVSQTPCTISSLTGKEGLTAYKVYVAGEYSPNYYPVCVNPQDQQAVAFCQNVIAVEPTYCVGTAMLATGQNTTATYYLNETYENGDLKLNKAILQFPYQIQNTYHMGTVTSVTLLYTNDPIWIENGVIKSGYEDRKGKFYDSNLYRAVFLNSIPGFNLVYSTSDGAVKIFKIAE